MSKPTILTGLRANNDLHLGNYFGALLPIVDMANTKADQYQINLFVPDLHSFTTPTDHNQMKSQIMNNLRIFVAAGLPLSHPDVHIYRQSYISAHSELTWILDCFTSMGEMGRMVQFKDKSTKLNEERISVGLFNYPVLMAADILLYDAAYIPVGADQSQHIEYTRDIAQRLNKRFDRELFIVPKPVKDQHEFFGKDQGLRIMDLQDPGKKMSKSDESGKGIIFMNETAESAKKKIMAATTDDFAQVQYDPQARPGISNLLEMLALLRSVSVKEVSGQLSGETSYGTFKDVVATEMVGFLNSFQSRLATVKNEDIEAKLSYSEQEMSSKAGQTLLRVQKAVGLR